MRVVKIVVNFIVIEYNVKIDFIYITRFYILLKV
jgi:hypothetical protein